jgi:hypothetical protein
MGHERTSFSLTFVHSAKLGDENITVNMSARRMVRFLIGEF